MSSSNQAQLNNASTAPVVKSEVGMKPNEKKKLPNENNVQSSNAKKMRNYNSKAAGTKRAASNTFFTVDNMKVYHKKSRKVTTLTNFDVAKQHGWGDGENAYKKNLYKQTLLKACMESRFEDVKTLITEHANEDFEGTILNEEHLCHIINGKTRDSNLTDVQVDIVEYLLQHVVTIHPRDSQAKNELDTAITNTRRPFGGFSQQMNKNFVSKWSYKTSALLAAFDKVLHIEDNQLPANVQRLIKILLLKMPDDENTHNFFCSLIHRFNNNNCHRYLEHLFQINSNQFGFQIRYSYTYLHEKAATFRHLLQRYRFNYVKLFVARHKEMPIDIAFKNTLDDDDLYRIIVIAKNILLKMPHDSNQHVKSAITHYYLHYTSTPFLSICKECRFEDLKLFLTNDKDIKINGLVLSNIMSRESIITDVQVDMIEYLLEHVVTMRPRFGHVSDSSHSREISYSDVVSALGNVLKNELSANAQRLIKIYLHKMPHDQEMHDNVYELKHIYEKKRNTAITHILWDHYLYHASTPFLSACKEGRFEDVKSFFTKEKESMGGSATVGPSVCFAIGGIYESRESMLTDVQVDIVEYLLNHGKWASYNALMAALDKTSRINLKEEANLPKNIERLLKMLLEKMDRGEKEYAAQWWNYGSLTAFDYVHSAERYGTDEVGYGTDDPGLHCRFDEKIRSAILHILWNYGVHSECYMNYGVDVARQCHMCENYYKVPCNTIIGWGINGEEHETAECVCCEQFYCTEGDCRGYCPCQECSICAHCADGHDDNEYNNLYNNVCSRK